MKKVVVFGSGHLGSIVAEKLAEGLLPAYQLVGVFGNIVEEVKALSERTHCSPLLTVEEIKAQKPDYIIEAATGDALKTLCVPLLETGANVIVLSVGAFADENFYQEVFAKAEALDRHVYLASGVVGGFDIMSTAMLMGDVSATITKAKPGDEPSLQILPDTYEASAREAITAYPRHLNIAVSIALGTVGVDKTKMKIHTLPDGSCLSFTTEVNGNFGKSVIFTELGTPERKPKGPEMAAYSALAVLKRLGDRIGFC